MITYQGREIRRNWRGPNGEEYQDRDSRELRFVTVDKYAPEKNFDDIQGLKKSQATCAICVEDFKNNDAVRLTTC
jgi:hypothetical protein